MIDSHTHLSDKKFDSDRKGIIENSISQGIDFFLEILCSKHEWSKKHYFEQYYERFYFAFGIHPHYTDEVEDEYIKELKKWLKSERCVAIGEMGIDLWHYPDKLKEQLNLLELQIEIANISDKPIIFHVRNSKLDNKAYDKFFEIIKGKTKKQAIIHSFSGELNDAKKAVDNGLLIGINATITYPKNNILRDVIKFVGIKNILTETDCPYLPPQRIRGQRNSPSSIKDILKTISSITKISIDKINSVVTENFLKITNQ